METTVLSLATLEIGVLEAFIELMFLAAYSDGEINAAERSAFASRVAAATCGKLSPEVVAMMLQHFETELAGAHREDCLADIRERIPVRMRRDALSIAINVVVADGILKLDEIAFLKRAATALELDLEVADSVLREAKA